MPVKFSDMAFPPEMGVFPSLSASVEPGAIRPECARLLEGATPISPEVTVAVPDDWDSPFTAYSAPTVKVRMFEVAPGREGAARDR